MLRQAANVRFLEGNTFEFDDGGDRAIIFHSFRPYDLIAWSARTNRMATHRGVAYAINSEAIWNPASWFGGSQLRVHRTPLEWLKANRDGIVVVQQERTHFELAAAAEKGLVFSDQVYAAQVRQLLVPPKRKASIFIEIDGERSAA